MNKILADKIFYAKVNNSEYGQFDEKVIKDAIDSRIVVISGLDDGTISLVGAVNTTLNVNEFRLCRHGLLKLKDISLEEKDLADTVLVTGEMKDETWEFSTKQHDILGRRVKSNRFPQRFNIRKNGEFYHYGIFISLVCFNTNSFLFANCQA